MPLVPWLSHPQQMNGQRPADPFSNRNATCRLWNAFRRHLGTTKKWSQRRTFFEKKLKLYVRTTKTAPLNIGELLQRLPRHSSNLRHLPWRKRLTIESPLNASGSVETCSKLLNVILTRENSIAVPSCTVMMANLAKPSRSFASTEVRCTTTLWTELNLHVAFITSEILT